jgi:hypothetical protein
MNYLMFNGIVASGCGLFRKEIVLPENLISDQESWMPTFVQGTLNIQLMLSELPKGFGPEGLRFIDLNKDYPPDIYRLGSEVENNTLKPNSERPQRGDLQLWKALLTHKRTSTSHKCFLMRRVGSGYRDKAEILGQSNFKENWDFQNGDQVSVTTLVG